MNEDKPDWLSAEIAALRTEVDPDHDLWPGIARRLDRMRNWLPIGVAASLIMSFGAAILAWHAHTAHEQELAALRTLLSAAVAPYDDALAGYRVRWPDLSGQFTPETRTDIEHGLAVVETAAAELIAALQDTPTDAQLLALLRQTRARELRLYEQAAELARWSI